LSTFIFLVFHINGLNIRRSFFEDLIQHTNVTSCPNVEWFRIHIRRLNVCHFGMVEVTGL